MNEKALESKKIEATYAYENGHFVEALCALSDRIRTLEGELRAIEEKKEKENKRIEEAVDSILQTQLLETLQEHRDNTVLLNIVATGQTRPYFLLEYYDKRDGSVHQGFGTYDYRIVQAYKEAYFTECNTDFLTNKFKQLQEEATHGVMEKPQPSA